MWRNCGESEQMQSSKRHCQILLPLTWVRACVCVRLGIDCRGRMCCSTPCYRAPVAALASTRKRHGRM